MSRWRRQLHRRHRLVRKASARFLAAIQRLNTCLPTYPGMRRFSVHDVEQKVMAEAAEYFRRAGRR